MIAGYAPQNGYEDGMNIGWQMNIKILFPSGLKIILLQHMMELCGPDGNMFD